MYHGFVLTENTHDCVQFDIHLTEDESNSLDKNTNGFVFERLRRHMQSPTHLGICLSFPVPSEVWYFFALKNNNVSELQDSGDLGKPTGSAVAQLIPMVDEKIALLSESIAGARSHEATSRFLQSEIDLLVRVNSFLRSGEDGNVGLRPGVGFLV